MMKNIISLILNLLTVAFVLGFICGLLNYAFGLHLGIKGAEVPADPVAAMAFLVLGGICGGLAYLVDRKK